MYPELAQAICADESDKRFSKKTQLPLLQYGLCCDMMAAVRRRAPLSVRRRSASPPWYKASTEVQALWGYHTGVGQCALSAVRLPLAPSRPTALAKRRTEKGA